MTNRQPIPTDNLLVAIDIAKVRNEVLIEAPNHKRRLRAGINDVQELSKTHEAIAKAKTEIWHRILTHYLLLYFPEIERFRGNSRSDWFFAFLDAFPTPASIMALSKVAFIEAAWDVVGRKVSKERLLADIYETARTSIGLPLPIDAPAIRMFQMVIAEARSLIRQRNEIEDMADATRQRRLQGLAQGSRHRPCHCTHPSWPKAAISGVSVITANS